jgi:D-alanine-D-alanine ligase
VNPLPGILPDPADNSCLPKAARAAGIGYEELIQSCLKYAAVRQGVKLGSARRAKRSSTWRAGSGRERAGVTNVKEDAR